MKKQLPFSPISDEFAKAKTSKKRFLEKIERIIPFDEWVEIIKPYYYKGESGNSPTISSLCSAYILFRIFLI